MADLPKKPGSDPTANPGAKIDQRLDRRLRNFSAAEHGQPLDASQDTAGPEEAPAAGEQPQPTGGQPKSGQDKESFRSQAINLAKDALKNAAIQAALPYIVGAVLIVGIVVIIIFGVTNYIKGLDNPSGPRPPDPVVAGRDTNDVARLLALGGDSAASLTVINKDITDVRDEINQLKTKIATIKDGGLRSQAQSQLQQIEDLVNNQLVPAVEHVQAEQTTSGNADNTRAKGNQHKLPIIVTTDLQQLKKLTTDLQTTLLKAAGSGGGSIAQLAVAEQVKGVFETNGDNVPRYRDGTVAPYSIGSAWCANFASWVYKQAGYPQLWNFNGHQSVPNVWDYMQKNELAWKATTNNPEHLQPQPGDLVFFYEGPRYGDGLDHIGIVVAINNDGTIDTVEGNYGNKVSKNSRVEVGYGIRQDHVAWRFARMGT